MDVQTEAPTSSTAGNSHRLGLCEVCASHDAKYTCPRCEVKTCSLRCNKIHKLEVECNGERDKAKFISLNKFTNMDLSSDYRLLEEITRVVESSKKSNPMRKFCFDKKSLRLQKEALGRKITLKLLPVAFQRHKMNTSHFDFKTKVIHWHVDVVFASGDLKIAQTVPENLKLGLIFEQCLTEQSQETMEALQYFQAAGLSGVKLLLKAEQQKGRKFYELDACDTLGENLKEKLLIEYPTIHVILKDQQSFYDIVDSDDEEEFKEELKQGHKVISNIIKKSESESSLYDSLKNLLFINEYSDEDVETADD